MEDDIVTPLPHLNVSTSSQPTERTLAPGPRFSDDNASRDYIPSDTTSDSDSYATASDDDQRIPGETELSDWVSLTPTVSLDTEQVTNSPSSQKDEENKVESQALGLLSSSETLKDSLDTDTLREQLEHARLLLAQALALSEDEKAKSTLQLTQMTEALKAKDVEVNALQDTLDQVKTLAELNEETLQRQYTRVSKELEAQATDVDTLRRNLGQARFDAETAKARLGAQEESHKARIAQLSETVKVKDFDIISLQQQLGKISHELAETRKLHEGKEKDLTARVHILETQLTSATSYSKSVRQELGGVRQKLEQERGQAGLNTKQHESRLEQLSRSLREKDSSLEATSAKLAKAYEDLEWAARRIQSDKSQFADLTCKWADDAKALAKSRDDLKDRLKGYKSEARTSQSLVTQWTDAYNKQAAEVKSLMSQLDVAQAQSEETDRGHQSEVKSFRKEISELWKALTTKKSEAERLRKERNEATTKLKEIQQQTASSSRPVTQTVQQLQRQEAAGRIQRSRCSQDMDWTPTASNKGNGW
ncbi:hypothetical protein DFP72DRAFT_484602 [Ephemerocybe angulata]|uniref:Uncharacterized protein n=1 Tax=Ephemerocybe angulata TaxID=980116 RepID=A0A8H6IHB6_9AGAR|nr:hypothetical protein DFP72DRAFT_484602 [Tulosesus angulatus]